MIRQLNFIPFVYARQMNKNQYGDEESKMVWMNEIIKINSPNWATRWSSKFDSFHPKKKYWKKIILKPIKMKNQNIHFF